MDEVPNLGTSKQGFYNPETSGSTPPVNPSVQGDATPQETAEDTVYVEWSASEYIAHEKTGLWYVGLFGFMAVVVVLMYAITRDMLATIVTFIASGTISVYAGRKPEVKQHKLAENGVFINEAFYPYHMFKSFSVVEEGAINSMWLKPMKRFSPLVVMYCAPEDEKTITDTLAHFLPHEQRELDIMDQISKRLRF